jgi:hypothetical protein
LQADVKGVIANSEAALLAAGTLVNNEVSTMWCSNCQQDTPGLANPTSGRIVCSRCQQPLQKRNPPYTSRICDEGLALDEPAETQPSMPTSAASPFRNYDWASRQRVRTAVRELRRPNPTTANSPNRILADRQRFDPPQDLFGQIEHATTPTIASVMPQLIPNDTAPKHSTGGQVVAWLIVMIGIAALSGGVGLMAWSLSTAQILYWNYATGLAMAGQGMLILGLILVISRLWRSSRYSSAKLQDVHVRLGQLQQTSEALVATRGGGAPAFYADLVRGASPHVMLANLKGQVDQLATRVGTAW